LKLPVLALLPALDSTIVRDRASDLREGKVKKTARTAA
jgi:hypothetical protein